MVTRKTSATMCHYADIFAKATLPYMAETMTHAAAARYLGCCVRSVYNYVARGLIREIPWGEHFTRVKAADVRKLAERGFRSVKK